MRTRARFLKLRALFLFLCVYVFVAANGPRATAPSRLRLKLNGNTSVLEAAIITGTRIMKHRRFVYVMFSNAAYLRFTKSWICNMLLQDDSVLHNTLFFTDSAEARADLLAFHGDLEVFVTPLSLSGAVEYGHFDYFMVALHRLKIQNELVQSGVSVMLVESDAVWLKPNVDCHLSALLRSNDIISADNHNFADNSREISAGFSGYRSSPSVKKLLSIYTSQYEESLRKYEGQSGFIGDLGEQVFFSKMLSAAKFDVY